MKSFDRHNWRERARYGNAKWIPRWKLRHHLFFFFFVEENCHSVCAVFMAKEVNACLMCRYAPEILIKLRFTSSPRDQTQTHWDHQTSHLPYTTCRRVCVCVANGIAQNGWNCCICIWDWAVANTEWHWVKLKTKNLRTMSRCVCNFQIRTIIIWTLFCRASTARTTACDWLLHLLTCLWANVCFLI